jgi:hypothetical protein
MQHFRKKNYFHNAYFLKNAKCRFLHETNKPSSMTKRQKINVKSGTLFPFKLLTTNVVASLPLKIDYGISVERKSF